MGFNFDAQTGLKNMKPGQKKNNWRLDFMRLNHPEMGVYIYIYIKYYMNSLLMAPTMNKSKTTIVLEWDETCLKLIQNMKPLLKHGWAKWQKFSNLPGLRLHHRSTSPDTKKTRNCRWEKCFHKSQTIYIKHIFGQVWQPDTWNIVKQCELM